MNKYWELHECENLPATGVQVLFSMDHSDRKAKTWRLIIQRQATEDDLWENHYLEEEGEIIWETSLEIIHCPFCGKKLFDKTASKFDDYGRFVHYDCSEWRYKRQ